MHARSAFTLVELSIVLVILGLLVGGVLAGQFLIRAAELRAITNEYERYQTALYTFRDKYFALPGDMLNATDYWTSAGGNGKNATCQAVGNTTGTCNGDGDGVWANNSSGVIESVRAWQHLSRAGMIEGQYIGTASSPIQLGTQIPRSKLSGTAFWLGGVATIYGKPNVMAMEYARVTTASWPNGGAISAEEAYNIDMKVDDGKPHTGRVMTLRRASLPNCVTTGDDAYLLSDQTIGCTLIFITGY